MGKNANDTTAKRTPAKGRLTQRLSKRAATDNAPAASPLQTARSVTALDSDEQIKWESDFAKDPNALVNGNFREYDLAPHTIWVDPMPFERPPACPQHTIPADNGEHAADAPPAVPGNLVASADYHTAKHLFYVDRKTGEVAGYAHYLNKLHGHGHGHGHSAEESQEAIAGRNIAKIFKNTRYRYSHIHVTTSSFTESKEDIAGLLTDGIGVQLQGDRTFRESDAPIIAQALADILKHPVTATFCDEGRHRLRLNGVTIAEIAQLSTLQTSIVNAGIFRAWDDTTEKPTRENAPAGNGSRR